jgi:hypothetical protein
MGKVSTINLVTQYTYVVSLSILNMKPVGDSIHGGSLYYFTPLPSRGGYAEAPAGGFPNLARQSGEQSSIGFQPVSSVDYGWLAVLSEPPISDCLDEKSKLVGGSIQAGSLCYATLRRCQVAAGTRKRLQEDFQTSRASPESKVA